MVTAETVRLINLESLCTLAETSVPFRPGTLCSGLRLGTDAVPEPTLVGRFAAPCGDNGRAAGRDHTRETSHTERHREGGYPESGGAEGEG